MCGFVAWRGLGCAVVTTKPRPRGVLFDSGDTLIQPIGGRWNPRFDFEGVVQRHFPTVTDDAFPAAIAAGQRLLGPRHR